MRERIILLYRAIRGNHGMARRELLDVVFFCPQDFVHSYYMLLHEERR